MSPLQVWKAERPSRLLKRKKMNSIIELKIPQQTIDDIFSIGCCPLKSIAVEWWNKDESVYVDEHVYVREYAKDSNIAHVNKGDKLCKINYQYPMTSPVNGYIIRRPFGVWSAHKEDASELILGIFGDSIEDIIKSFFGKIECTLVTDPFSRKQRIDGVFNGYWNKLIGTYPLENSILGPNEDSFIWMQIAGNIFLRFEFVDDKAIISFDTIEKDRIHKGDTISLLLDNDTILDYTLSKKPINKMRYGFTLYQDDIDALLNNRIMSCRITHSNEELLPMDLEFRNDVLGDYAQEALHYCLRVYLDEVHKLIPTYQFPIRNVKKTQKGFGFNWCYVYLMKDISNGYYKIGISNTPEYRERTLQSEKPTIEMLACKKFPTRKIAEAIESALHTAYSQQRLRGEWFNLSDADVAAIIETLK